MNDQLEDRVLANDPRYVNDRDEADADLAAGRTRSLERFLADLDEED